MAPEGSSCGSAASVSVGAACEMPSASSAVRASAGAAASYHCDQSTPSASVVGEKDFALTVLVPAPADT